MVVYPIRKTAMRCRASAFTSVFKMRNYVQAGLAGLFLSSSVMAQSLPTLNDARVVNDSTVGIVFHFEDYYRRLIDDMSKALPGEQALRIVPIIGNNHVQTIYDMLFMQGVDLGIVHSDVLEYIARYQDYEQVYRLINGLVELYGERVAIIANDSIESLEDLAGQRVNFGIAGKGADITATLVFDTLGVAVEPVRLGLEEALEQVKSNEIAAHVHLLEDPVDELLALRPEDGVRLLALPQSTELLKIYDRGELTSNDFPNLIDGEQTIQSLSVAVMIATYNWRPRDKYRYNKLLRFVTAFGENFDVLASGEYDSIWQSVSLAKDIPGAVRLPMFQNMLDEFRETRAQEIALEERRTAEELDALREELLTEINARIEVVKEPEQLQGLFEDLEQLVEDNIPSAAK